MPFRLPGPAGPAAALTALLIAASASPGACETISVVGAVTDKGAECPAIQGDDGKLYTLTPREAVGLLAPGARIRVEGTVAEMSICQQGVTIEVTKIEPAR